MFKRKSTDLQTENQPTLTASQENALKTILESRQRIQVLAGYAGTGKTFLVGLLAQALINNRLAVGFGAPTNKAAGILRGKVTHGDVRTLHQWLKFAANLSDDGTVEFAPSSEPNDLKRLDWLIVDEASMISNGFYDLILQYGPKHILFVGDPAQLPPVGDDNCPVFTLHEPVRLMEIVRQAADNPIIGVSMLIRDAIAGGKRARIGDEIMRLQSKQVLVARAYSVLDVAEQVLAHGDARAIAYTNARVEEINLLAKTLKYGNEDWPIGAPVIVHSEYRRASRGQNFTLFEGNKLMTSTELIVRERQDAHVMEHDCWRLRVDNYYVWVIKDKKSWESDVAKRFAMVKELKSTMMRLKPGGEQRVMKQRYQQALGRAWDLKQAFCDLRYNFAITAHKSQGSTYAWSVLDMRDLGRFESDSDYNRALYVALTRSSEGVVFCY